MSMNFSNTGNLGATPELRFASIGGEQRSVCDLRIYFDRLVTNPDKTPDAPSMIDDGGVWLTGSVWDAKADQAIKLLKKGMRLWVRGEVVEAEPYKNRDGETVVGLRLVIREYAVVITPKIDGITLAARADDIKNAPPKNGATKEPKVPTGAGEFNEDDIPDNAFA